MVFPSVGTEDAALDGSSAAIARVDETNAGGTIESASVCKNVRRSNWLIIVIFHNSATNRGTSF
jgi:hypothetical protein